MEKKTRVTGQFAVKDNIENGDVSILQHAEIGLGSGKDIYDYDLCSCLLDLRDNRLPENITSLVCSSASVLLGKLWKNSPSASSAPS